MTTASPTDRNGALLLEQAIQLIGKNDLAAAEKLVAQALLAQPDNCDAPQLLGTRASHGCIRIRNSDVVRMARIVRPGTPVDIVP